MAGSRLKYSTQASIRGQEPLHTRFWRCSSATAAERGSDRDTVDSRHFATVWVLVHAAVLREAVE